MTTLADEMKQDYCHYCFAKHIEDRIPEKVFKMAVVHHRTAEKLAVIFDDVVFLSISFGCCFFYQTNRDNTGNQLYRSCT